MHRRRSASILGFLALTCLFPLGCGRSAGTQPATARPARTLSTARWSGREHVRGVVDLSAPRPGGALIVAAAGRLLVRQADGQLQAIDPAYSAPSGLEPYIALSAGQRVKTGRCAFVRDELFALRLEHGNGVSVVDARGRVRRFAPLPGRGLLNGIAFDTTGRFGHRLLVTSGVRGRTTVYAIDCRGRVQVLTRSAPRIEGGIAVAPASFGRFGGDLISPDEISGRLYAIQPNGRFQLVADSGMAHGQDVGVESEGFVPIRYGDALVADRLTPHNRHPGDDLILGMSHAVLAHAGVHPGDLVAVNEGGARAVAITCRASCRTRSIGSGPAIAHIEGHVVFTT